MDTLYFLAGVLFPTVLILHASIPVFIVIFLNDPERAFKVNIIITAFKTLYSCILLFVLMLILWGILKANFAEYLPGINSLPPIEVNHSHRCGCSRGGSLFF